MRSDLLILSLLGAIILLLAPLKEREEGFAASNDYGIWIGLGVFAFVAVLFIVLYVMLKAQGRW